MNLPKGRAIGLVVGAALAVSGCSGTIDKQSTLGGIDTLRIDARQRLAFVADYRDRQNVQRRALCVEPSPDAAVARAAALAASGNAPLPPVGGVTSPGPISAGFGASSSEAVASLGIRTQTIELLRDGYYRACEGLINGVIDDDDYAIILANIDATMIALAAVDALSVAGTTRAPGVAITSGGATGTASPGSTTVLATAGGGMSSPLVVQTESPASQAMTAAQAEAIRAIALEAMKNARERQNFVYQMRLRQQSDQQISGR
jgi:hypothetical protein